MAGDTSKCVFHCKNHNTGMWQRNPGIHSSSPKQRQRKRKEGKRVVPNAFARVPVCLMDCVCMCVCRRSVGFTGDRQDSSSPVERRGSSSSVFDTRSRDGNDHRSRPGSGSVSTPPPSSPVLNKGPTFTHTYTHTHTHAHIHTHTHTHTHTYTHTHTEKRATASNQSRAQSHSPSPIAQSQSAPTFLGFASAIFFSKNAAFDAIPRICTRQRSASSSHQV
jgi:ABC-type nickel/cobalt efflux system permease component RcnA